MKRTPLIIDCDPGHDDAIALILALSCEKLDVKGIVTVAGNSTLDNTTENALKVLELIGCKTVPVVPGRHNPILHDVNIAIDIHGESGMDGPQLPMSSLICKDINYIEFIKEILESSDEPVVIVTMGPLTNIATFILAYPEYKSKIAYISSMAGGVYEGNRSPTAEFNVWNDPEAAYIVINSGIEIKIYGLDVTHKSYIAVEEFELFRREQGRIYQFVADLLDFYAIGYVNHRGMKGCPMHDACAVLGVINPDIFESFQTYVDVDLCGNVSRGSLIVDFRPQERRLKRESTSIAMDVNRQEMLNAIIKACSYFEEKERDDES